MYKELRTVSGNHYMCWLKLFFRNVKRMHLQMNPSYLSAKFCFLMEAPIGVSFGDISIRAQCIFFVLHDHMTT